MSALDTPPAELQHLDRFYIDGEWATPSTDAKLTVTDSATEDVFLTVAEAKEADIARAVSAARQAFDTGPWPRMSHAERAGYLRAIAEELRKRADQVGDIWPRESGILHSVALSGADGAASTFDYYAGLADTYPCESEATPTAGGDFGLLVHEPVGVVGAIIPWNGPDLADLPQGRSGADRRVHCRAQDLARGAGYRLRHRGDRRGGGPAAGRAQRAVRRP